MSRTGTIRAKRPSTTTKVAAAGKSFAFIKATERTAYLNPAFATDIHEAAAAGLDVAPYHFYRGEFDPKEQAEFFVKTFHSAGYSGFAPGELPPVADVEWAANGGCPPGTTVDNVLTFLRTVQLLSGVRPMIYTQQSFVNSCLGGTTALGHYRLWTVDYSRTPPRLAPGFPDYTFWQYTIGAVDGVPTSATNKVDLDTFHGTARQLAELAHRCWRQH
ncbi:glycoside hydrolase family 25 protein [Fodinicola feengrottensis]|uniref:glycoside hydrolase family 25 protein n=1 Tax=Fodinicola feengrottensis TaxID=435914 RepID=UPI0013D54F6D|nr:GH25 family lysozyme [Fodinicola feengrottensis]